MSYPRQTRRNAPRAALAFTRRHPADTFPGSPAAVTGGLGVTPQHQWLTLETTFRPPSAEPLVVIVSSCKPISPRPASHRDMSRARQRMKRGRPKVRRAALPSLWRSPGRLSTTFGTRSPQHKGRTVVYNSSVRYINDDCQHRTLSRSFLRPSAHSPSLSFGFVLLYSFQTPLR